MSDTEWMCWILQLAVCKRDKKNTDIQIETGCPHNGWMSAYPSIPVLIFTQISLFFCSISLVYSAMTLFSDAVNILTSVGDKVIHWLLICGWFSAECLTFSEPMICWLYLAELVLDFTFHFLTEFLHNALMSLVFVFICGPNCRRSHPCTCFDGCPAVLEHSTLQEAPLHVSQPAPKQYPI